MIFVNDGSTDNTKTLAEKYLSDPKFQIINKENGGCVSARKAGVKIAKGEYIMFVDGDDWINFDLLSNFAKYIENEKPDVIRCGFFNQERDETFTIINDEKNLNGITQCEGYEFLNLMLKNKIIHSVCIGIYKREFMLKSGYLNYPEVSMAEDFMTNCFLGVHKPKVKFVDVCGYYYRFNFSSVTKIGSEKIIEQAKTMQYIEDYLKNFNLYDKYKPLMDYQWFWHGLLYTMSNININLKLKNISAYREKIKNFRVNKYSLEHYKKMGHGGKLELNTLLYFPKLVYLVLPPIKFIREVKHFIKSVMRVFSGQN